MNRLVSLKLFFFSNLIFNYHRSIHSQNFRINVCLYDILRDALFLEYKLRKRYIVIRDRNVQFPMNNNTVLLCIPYIASI